MCFFKIEMNFFSFFLHVMLTNILIFCLKDNLVFVVRKTSTKIKNRLEWHGLCSMPKRHWHIC